MSSNMLYKDCVIKVETIRSLIVHRCPSVALSPKLIKRDDLVEATLGIKCGFSNHSSECSECTEWAKQIARDFE